MKHISVHHALLGLVLGLTLMGCQHGSLWHTSPSADRKQQDGYPELESRNVWAYDDRVATVTTTSAEDAKPLAVEASRRTHIRFPDEQSSRDFLVLFERRNAVTNDLVALQRFLMEQQQRVEAFDRALGEHFDIDLSKNYHYDMEARTIYVVNAAAAPDGEGMRLSTNDTTQVIGEIHKVFDDVQQSELFGRLVRGKQLALEVQAALAVIVRQKERELLRLRNGLAEQYSMSRDREYEYDSESRELVEVIREPGR